jgi:hypothetical protein
MHRRKRTWKPMGKRKDYNAAHLARLVGVVLHAELRGVPRVADGSDPLTSGPALGFLIVARVLSGLKGSHELRSSCRLRRP